MVTGAYLFFSLMKVDLVSLQPLIAEPILADKTLLVVPRRTAASWATYPLEQFHSESFGNLVAHNYAVAGGLLPASQQPVDWFFGPLAFERSQATHFLEYTGTLWDAQIVPMIKAAWTAKDFEMASTLTSVDVDFAYPPEQLKLEEATVEYSEKRLMQLNVILPVLRKAFMEHRPATQATPTEANAAVDPFGSAAGTPPVANAAATTDAVNAGSTRAATAATIV